VIAYHGKGDAVFAGRETGSYGHWRQYHHHGSIDDPGALRAYQQAVGG
jgi:hypothetical protein